MRLLLALLLVSCSTDPDQSAVKSQCQALPTIQTLYYERLSRMPTAEGWLLNDCDAMLWSAKYASITGAPPFPVELAEREPGRFERRPAPCWTEDEGDIGSKTTWSRDMGTGFMLYAWRAKRLDIAERHYAYGQEHDWMMGFPTSDGRAYYTPSMRGKLAQVVFALGGPDHPERRWPDLYPSGLVDYPAHLQVLGITLRGEIAYEILRPPTATTPVVDDGLTLLNISVPMLEVLSEQADREKGNSLFQAAYGRYSGDMTATEASLLSEPWFVPSYVRCGDQALCEEIEWLFAADLYMRNCEGV